MNREGFLVFLFLLLFFGLPWAIYIWELKYEEKRVKQLAILAKKLELTFVPRLGDPALLNLESFDLFSWGRSKRVFNLMQGDISGIELLIFDYTYVPILGKVGIPQSIICFGLPSNQLPVFQQGYSNKVIEKLFIRELRLLGKSRSGIKMEMSKDYFVYYRPNKRVSPEKILAFGEEGVDALNLFLDFASKPII